MPSANRLARVRRLQWTALALCVLAITINYVDRATVAIGTVEIRQEFGLSATAIGAMTSVWSISFALAQLPTGFLVDRIGSRPFLGIALFVWSLAQAAGGIASSFTHLLWARVALGIGEAPAYPTSVRVVGNWFPKSKRGMPTGVYNSSSYIAPTIAPPLLTALMLAFGWRAMFVIMGAAGIVVCIAWLLIYRDSDTVALSEDEREHIGEHQPTTVTLRDWGSLFAFSSMWGLIAGNFGISYVMWMYQAWLPSYLETQHHVSIAKTGFVGSIPWICGIFGSLSAGYFSDVFAKRFADPVAGRKIPVICGVLGLALFTALAAFATSTVGAVICISLAIFSTGCAAGGHWSMVSAVSPPGSMASSASIQNCGGYIGATFSPIVTGFVLDVTGSFQVALLIAAGVAVVTAGLYSLLIRQPIDLDRGAAVKPAWRDLSGRPEVSRPAPTR